MPPETKIIETKPIFQTRFLHMLERVYEFAGQTKKWWFVSRNPNPTGYKNKKPDAVVCIGIMEEGTGKEKIVMISEFRIALGSREIAFPAGLIDNEDYDGTSSIEEAAKVAAIREYKEETGLDFYPVFVSEKNLYASAGLTDESSIFVFGTVEGTPRDPVEEEDIRVKIVGIEDSVDVMHCRGEYEGHTISQKAWLLMGLFRTIDKLIGGGSPQFDDIGWTLKDIQKMFDY